MREMAFDMRKTRFGMREMAFGMRETRFGMREMAFWYALRGGSTPCAQRMSNYSWGCATNA
jgi:hypothetical protein